MVAPGSPYTRLVPHPFDRYAPFVDLEALKEFSAKPLRKCLRVNTLKTTPEKVIQWGKKRGWTFDPVPWCPEGFFIDREDRSQALGRDVLQLLGHFYIQEASSMLPPSLVGPVPGEAVLDIASAPGSKTSQMAADMGNRGVIIANDVQENRLWTLKTALHRLGMTNTIVTKKVGQWFSKHMAERFDAVLCDAPCTAQGTVRKDSDALKYCSIDNIEKMAALQISILRSAIDTLKVGGRAIYSTCTLTPEENEGVIAEMLNTFGDQIEVLDPGVKLKTEHWVKTCIEDSYKVQDSLGLKKRFPAIRLWPQTCDSEGFFAVLIEKKAPTKQPEQMDWIPPQEIPMPRARIADISKSLTELFGTDFLDPGDSLWLREDQLMLLSEEATDFLLPLQDYALGLPFAKLLPDKRVRVSHEIVTLRGNRATKNRWDVAEEDLQKLLKGQDIDCAEGLSKDHLLFFEDICVGRGLAKNGQMKNNLPRTMILP